MNLWPFFLTFLVIAAAELGDKTQLLTLGFASRYPAWTVIGAVSTATALLMALAVIFGKAINYYIPETALQVIAGIIFILFGLWTLFGKEEDEEESKSNNHNPFWLVFGSFFLAELGDKTQLATLTLSAKYGTPFQVWVGATAGMVGVNVIAALAGNWVKTVVSQRAIKVLGSAVFLIFGIVTLLGVTLR